MGVFGSKISAMDIPWLVKQLNGCQLPVDRNQVLDYLEQIDQNLLDKKTLNAQSKLFKDADGMRTTVRVGKRLVEDIFVITVVAQIVEDVKMDVPLIMDFIEFGGVDLLEKAIRVHAKDDYLMGILPKLIRVVLAVGASACIEDINEQGLNLLLCHKCQETIERNKNPFSIKPIVVPHPRDRVNRVLRFMDNFLSRADVQIVGLDAVIKYCRNADAINAGKETEVFFVLGKCAEQHKENSMVLWRIAMSFSLLASLQGELAMSVVSTNVHDILIDAFPKFQAHTMVQQQILWMFGNLLLWQRSKKMMHKSIKVMEFFKLLVGDPLADKKKLEQEARLRQLENDAKSIASGGGKSLSTIGTSTLFGKASAADTASKGGPKQKLSAVDESKGGGDMSSMSKSKYQALDQMEDEEQGKNRDDINDDDAENGPALEGSSIEIAIPVQIRAFIRETQGRLYKEKKNGGNSNQPQTYKQRRNFNERPLFGTVSTRLFTPGEQGLVADGDEDEAGNKKPPPPEWEKHLNYGEEVDKEAKKAKRAQIRKMQEEKTQQMYD